MDIQETCKDVASNFRAGSRVLREFQTSFKGTEGFQGRFKTFSRVSSAFQVFSMYSRDVSGDS